MRRDAAERLRHTEDETGLLLRALAQWPHPVSAPPETAVELGVLSPTHMLARIAELERSLHGACTLSAADWRDLAILTRFTFFDSRSVRPGEWQTVTGTDFGEARRAAREVLLAHSDGRSAPSRHPETVEVLTDYVRFARPVGELRRRLSDVAWGDTTVVPLTRADVGRALERWAAGALSAVELMAWAEGAYACPQLDISSHEQRGSQFLDELHELAAAACYRGTPEDGLRLAASWWSCAVTLTDGGREALTDGLAAWASAPLITDETARAAGCVSAGSLRRRARRLLPLVAGHDPLSCGLWTQVVALARAAVDALPDRGTAAERQGVLELLADTERAVREAFAPWRPAEGRARPEPGTTLIVEVRDHWRGVVVKTGAFPYRPPSPALDPRDFPVLGTLYPRELTMLNRRQCDLLRDEVANLLAGDLADDVRAGLKELAACAVFCDSIPAGYLWLREPG